MKKVLILYGSTTGTTEISSEYVQETLEKNGLEVERVHVLGFDTSQFDDYEYIIIGCSTWDYGGLQYDFEDFFPQFKIYNFEGKNLAIFGTGDKAYGETYCMALQTIQDAVEENNGKIILDSLDIECDLPSSELDKIVAWSERLSKAILSDKVPA